MIRRLLQSIMGRVKSVAIKTLGDELIAEHGERFMEDFEHNKKVLEEVRPIKSKRVRNILAGYITRKMKSIKKQGI
jgi:small subunit ribosomal protein S17e